MKYCIFAPVFEPANRLFDDVRGLENVTYFRHPIDKFFLRRIMYAHYGRLKKIPFKKIWNLFINKPKIGKKEEIIFVYMGRVEVFSNYATYMKKKFPNSKHVIYFLDVNNARRMDMKLLKDVYDDIYIFDMIEARKLDIKYYPIPFSKVDNHKSVEIVSDVAFVGQGKSRVYDIITLCKKLNEIGLKCKFYLIGVEESEREYIEGIEYGDFISPEEALMYILTTKCVLELKVDGVESYSDRVMKAIAYNKRILTNNRNIRNCKYYDQRYMFIYQDVNEISISFFQESCYAEYNYENDYSPVRFLEHLKENM